MPGLSVLNRCNNNCVMCTNPADFWAESKENFSYASLSERITKFSEGNNEFLENYRDAFSLSGGEPTLSANIASLTKRIKRLFPKSRIIFLTNGRMFFYPEYTKKILSLHKNMELIIPIHGYDEGTHDTITQVTGSFSQTIEGLSNLFRFRNNSHLIEIRVVIHKLNYQYLRKTTFFIKKKFPWIDRLVYVFFEIEGKAAKNIKILKISYKEVLPFINELYSLVNYFREVRFYHFPLCTLPKYFSPYIWRTLPGYEVSFLRRCRLCKVKKYCLGIHKGYLKYVGDSDFHAVTNKNTFTETNDWHHPIV